MPIANRVSARAQGGCSMASLGSLNGGKEPWWKSFRLHAYTAFVVRIALIWYGEWHDARNLVKFTDVDYRVFTDGARYMSAGESPYLRHTYRYSPLLAFLLLPNITVHPLWGKVLFCALDIVAGFLIKEFVRKFHAGSSGKLAAAFWLYNPLVFVISARGNAEAIIVCLMLITLHLFRERVFLLSGLAFGLSIHFRLFPIVFAPAFYLALSNTSGIRSLFQINLARTRFVIGTLMSLALSAYVCYWKYGEQFMEQTYYYHLNRRDIRHNFSAYFYMLYLTVEDEDIGINLLTFLPQVVLLLALTKTFGNIYDLSFGLFCMTHIFVAYNKVITSQYFLWYLALLPLSLPQLKFSRLEAVICLIIWVSTQASWLLPAYYLEFQGTNTFQVIWMESLALFMANIGLLSKFIRKYKQNSPIKT